MAQAKDDMKHPQSLGFFGPAAWRRVLLPWAAVAFALPLAACGDYEADPVDNDSGGQTTGGAGTGGAGTGGAGTGGMQQQAPDASCENVAACGGDPVGVWFAQESCLPISGVAALSNLGLGTGCDEGPIEGQIEVTGNFTVGADGSISDNTSTSGSVDIELVPECLEVSGTVTECDKIGIPLTSAGFDNMDCVDSETTVGGCTCTGTFTQSGGMGYILAFNANTSGTYTSADNALTVSGTSYSADLDMLDYDYCVDGNFALVTPTSPTALGVTNGTIVLQKQP